MQIVAWFALLMCFVSGAYSVIAIAAGWRLRSRKDPPLTRTPKVAILKPVRGSDPAFREAIESHARMDYPDYEVLFGFGNPQDAAREVVTDLQRTYPKRAIRSYVTSTETPNRKVGVLMDLLRETDAEVIVVNDADIRVEPDYLKRIVAPLEDPQVGLVTCAYRARWNSFASHMEAIGVVTEFGPGALVAPFFGFGEYGLGSTLCFRREHLESLGGFAALSEFLADDYQLGRLTARSGKRNYLSTVVVETALSGTWSEVWAHQLRWLRTIRLSRFDGYIGIPVMQAGVWVLLAVATGQYVAAGILLLLRWATAIYAGGFVLGATHIYRDLPLIPLRDVLGFVAWLQGLSGTTVIWRDRKLTLTPEGRIRFIE